MKVRDVIKRVEEDGWVLVSVKGSHRQYKHPTKKGKVTVPGNPGKGMPIGTYLNIIKQAQLEERKQ